MMMSSCSCGGRTLGKRRRVGATVKPQPLHRERANSGTHNLGDVVGKSDGRGRYERWMAGFDCTPTRSSNVQSALSRCWGTCVLDGWMGNVFGLAGPRGGLNCNRIADKTVRSAMLQRSGDIDPKPAKGKVRSSRSEQSAMLRCWVLRSWWLEGRCLGLQVREGGDQSQATCQQDRAKRPADVASRFFRQQSGLPVQGLRRAVGKMRAVAQRVCTGSGLLFPTARRVAGLRTPTSCGKKCAPTGARTSSEPSGLPMLSLGRLLLAQTAGDGATTSETLYNIRFRRRLQTWLQRWLRAGLCLAAAADEK
jgi:hypothetical protein